MGRQMGIFSCSRALRVAVMAWVVLSFGPVPDLAAGTLLSPGPADLVRKSAEPFGVFAFRLAGGGLREKWLGVQRKLDEERVQLALCDGDRERCVSPAALRFLAIVDNAKAREGRARLGEINRAINLAIHPMSDLAQYGEIDVWSSPLVTFVNGAGDCEDYAIAKFVALQEAGVSADDLRIVILRDDIREEDHAVVAARLDGKWLMLDNLHMVMAASAGLLPPRRHDTFVDIGFDQDVGLAVGCGARHRPDVQRRMRPGRLSEIFDAAGNVTFGNPRKLDRRDKVFGTLLRR